MVPNIKDCNTKGDKVDNVVFEDVQLYRHRVVSDQISTKIPPFIIMTLPGTNNFEVNDRYGTIAAGNILIFIICYCLKYALNT